MKRRADEDFAKAERAFRTVVPSYKGSIRSWLLKLRLHFDDHLGQEILRVSKDPNLRCLECGWKYNFQLISQCPICRSERSRMFLDDDPFSNPFAIVFYTLISFAIFAFGLSLWDH
jgi:hypothetical protein